MSADATVADELAAMRKLVNALDTLDHTAQQRVLWWLGSRYKPTASIEIRREDERLEVLVNGEEVATANHDDHGWSGMDAVESATLAVARALGVEPEASE